jgi:hypothetical protein
MAAASCAPAPIYRPIKGGDVDTGAGSLESIRRQIQGTWTLLAYEVYQQGKAERLPAAGQMKIDEYGNLEAHGQLKRTSASGAEKPPLLLNYSGRAVIDTDTHHMRLLDVESQKELVPEPIEAAVNRNNVRVIDLKGDSLTFTILGSNGEPTASSSWKRAK